MIATLNACGAIMKPAIMKKGLKKLGPNGRKKMQIYVVEVWDSETTYWEDYMAYSSVEAAMDTYRDLILKGFSVRVMLHMHMQEYWSKKDEEALA
jgi:hypothetical protein